MKTNLKRDRESDSSTAEQNAASTNDGSTGKAKKKASPPRKTPRKGQKVSESIPPKHPEQDLRVRVLKRKIREHGEGPTKKKRRSEESASSSTDTETSSPLESCSTSLEDVRRTAGEDGEGPSRKRKRGLDPEESKEMAREDLSVDAQRAEFEAKYKQKNHLGEGGCGFVFAGIRKADNIPVAIKYISKNKVFCKHVENGRELSVEVAVMLKLAAGAGTSAPVSLLDWYDLERELILVLERPVPSQDLFKYIQVNGGSLQEEEAKVILKQLVDAARELEDKCVFHRDIKVENILIETSSDVPRVRLIDFGLSCFTKKRSFYRVFYGTSAHVPPEWYHRCIYRPGPTTVWQLGVVLFDSLHSKSTFQTTKFLGNRLKFSSRLSKNCRDFLQMCLTKSPEQRPTLKQLQLHPWLK
ncbi:serine/threonine-protein kinase pim-1-like [Pempheris klunzingeri]|uniref:serine/threonine-protein kinase pim-1-like n=1 Tax=Pempheris klunzingeri TaxID=3127111 RepID=UPI00397FBF2D